MASPLRKRFPREMRNNLGKYLGIFLLMSVTIALTSGFLTAAHSISVIIDDIPATYHVEDGRFTTAFEATDAQLDAARDAAEDAGGIDVFANWSINADCAAESNDGRDCTLRTYAHRTDVDLAAYAEGRVPEGALKLAERESDALPVVTTLVNKWSNNLIARHIFLTLGTLRNAPDEADSGSRTAGGAFAPMERPRPGVDTDDARAVLAGWLAEKGVPDGAVMIDNGSGLSRTSRVTARAMTQILAAGWLSPRMTEYAASLPVSGVDGTMRKRLEATGRTHLKTGYLQDVRSIGGYVYAKNGRRYALYASVHGERNMAGGIRFLDKVVEWTYLQK